jgi:SAM-dependent methyltransferase
MVLELGCGLGGLAQRLADEHWLRVYAVDVSPTMHRLGAVRFRDAWVLRTLPDRRGRLPLRRTQCTGAIVQRMLLHLAHPCLITGLLTEARRVLRPGAPLAIVETDTHDGQGTCADGEPYVEGYRLRDGSTLPTTAWRHSPATIVGCMASAGFVVDEIRPLPVPAADPTEAASAGRAETIPAPLLLYLARAG